MNAQFSHLAEEIEIQADPCIEDLIDFSSAQVPKYSNPQTEIRHVLFLILDLSIFLLAFLIGAMIS